MNALPRPSNGGGPFVSVTGSSGLRKWQILDGASNLSSLGLGATAGWAFYRWLGAGVEVFGKNATTVKTGSGSYTLPSAGVFLRSRPFVIMVRLIPVVAVGMGRSAFRVENSSPDSEEPEHLFVLNSNAAHGRVRFEFHGHPSP